MVRKLIIACAIMGLSLGVVQAQDDMMGDEPPMHPEVILGPPEGFEPPEDMPPPPMDDPEAAKEMMLETFFNFMDADGSGAVDRQALCSAPQTGLDGGPAARLAQPIVLQR